MSDSSRPVVQVVASAPVVEGAGGRLRGGGGAGGPRGAGRRAPGARGSISAILRDPVAQSAANPAGVTNDSARAGGPGGPRRSPRGRGPPGRPSRRRQPVAQELLPD